MKGWTTFQGLKPGRIGLVAVAASLWAVSGAEAELILGRQDWDPVAGEAVWTSEYGWSSLSTPATGGDTGGWLRVTFPATVSEPPDEWYDILHTSASGLFAGGYTTNQFIQFDFWAESAVANKLQVRWKGTNDYIWGNVVTPPTEVGVWKEVRSATFGNWDDWDIDAAPGLSQEMFVQDLASISWIGVYVFRTGEEEAIYGVDNFSLMVPEPAECLMLAVAAVTTALSARRRKRGKRNDRTDPTDRADPVDRG